MLKAIVAPVQIGYWEIEGLSADDGNFYVAIPQLAAMELVPHGTSVNRLKPLLGESLSSSIIKLKTPLNSKEVNAISILVLEELLFNLSLKGNSKAIAISRSLLGMSLYKLFCIAFKKKCDDDYLQEYLKERQRSIQTRRSLTDAIHDWYVANKGDRPEHIIYAIVTNKIYSALWGMTAEDIESHLSCKRHKSRCFMSAESLHVLEIAEANVRDCIDYDGMNPISAADYARIRRQRRLPDKLEVNVG